MKDEGIYGKNAVIYDGVIRAFLPAVIHYMRNRKFLSRKNMRKFVPAYDPDEIIRELALNEWGAEPVKQPELDKELVKELLREVLREGIAL